MELQEAISNQTRFSLTLAKHLMTTTNAKYSNFVCSPLSIHVVLSMVAAGSKGPTQEQILWFLNSKSSQELNTLSSQLVTLLLADGGPVGGPPLSVANGVWVDQSLSLKKEFKGVVNNVYMAVSDHVDFQNKYTEVIAKVNAWADKETSGLIKEILPSGSVDDTTRLVFANAIYFKGTWNEKFDPSETKDHDFFLMNGDKIQVPFMTNNKRQHVCGFNDFKVLGLPYKQGEDKRKFSMYIFLPDAKDGLPSLVEKLGSEPGFIENHLPHRKVETGNFLIPKFKIEFGLEVSRVFEGLGLVLPFKGDGLTEMVDSAVGVSGIIHKSFIEVNEEGTEAAAVTTVFLSVQCLVVEEKLDFVADHPFAFVIREDSTGVVFFVGQVLKPEF